MTESKSTHDETLARAAQVDRRPEQSREPAAADRTAREREGEPNGLCGLLALVERPDLSLDELLDDVVRLLPPAWQFPEIAAARIVLGDQTFQTEGFRETSWVQTRKIGVGGDPIGRVQVCYLEERPASDEGPFRAGERRLLDAVAGWVGRLTERMRTEGMRTEGMRPEGMRPEGMRPEGMRPEGEGRRSNARLQALYDHSPLAIGFSRDGVNLGANAAYLRLFGHETENEIIGRSSLDQIAPRARPRIAAQIASRRRGEPLPSSHETTGLRRDGTEFPASIHVARVEQADGPVTLAFVEDITERKETERALAESEQRLRAIVENTPDHLVVQDSELRYEFVLNPQLGLTVEGMVGKTDADILEPDDAERLTRIKRHVLETGQTTAASVTLKNRQGQQEFFEGAYVARRDLAGAINGVTGYFRNVTERTRSEQALQASEEKFRSLFDNAAIGMFRTRLDGSEVLDVNDAFLRIFGRTREEMIGRPSAVQWADPRDREEMVRRLDADGRVSDVEYRMLTGGGEVRHCLTSFTLHREQGILEGSLIDITDRKRSEEALRHNEQILAASQRQTHIGSFEYDFAAGRLRWSEEMFRIFGITKAEFLGTQEDFLRRVHPEDLPTLAEIRRQGLVPDVGTLQFEVRILRPDGAPRHIRLVFDTTFDADGQPLRRTGTFLDITEAKEAEAERARLEAQLRQAQKMEAVGRLAGGVAHDFNNMLSVILGNVEHALQEADPSQPLHADLEEVRGAAMRSADLTRQLLAFARKQTVAPRVLDLNGTVGSMLKMLRRLLGEDLELTWQPGAELWSVFMDPSQIDQVLANLCVNARDAVVGVGTIALETTNRVIDAAFCARHPGAAPGDYVCLGVSDDGCGMDEETQAKLFEPFFTTKERGKGTGLGLATVYGIVRQNDGFIDVQSQPGRGTSFAVYLPRYQAKAERTRAGGAVPATRRGQETILLVEDEPAVLRLARRMLERQGYTVLPAGTPGEALRLAREHVGELDLLLTDVIMPEMNGRELAENLLSLHPGLKRLFMSGYTADVIAHHGVLDESAAFLQKPFHFEDLTAKVRAVLDGETPG